MINNSCIYSFFAKLLCLCSLFLTTGFPSLANDTSFGDRNGSIVLLKQSEISMSKEHLLISQNQIDVDYIFINHSAADVSVPLAFPMPPMSFDEGDHSVIENFKLWVDGKPIKTERRLVILLEDGTDISNQVKQLGWTEDILIRFLSQNDLPEGLKPLPKEWFNKDKEPLFTLQEYFVWQQTFPAGKAVNIRHSYQPSITSGVPQPADHIIETYSKMSCIDKDMEKTIHQSAQKYGAHWAHLEYILKTGAHWKDGTIGDFTLRIRKSDPTDSISLCFDGDLQKIDALTFEFSQKNYNPLNDLSILFIQKAPKD